jgi:hypothetical protein
VYITPSASNANASEKDADDSRSIQSKQSYNSEVEFVNPKMEVEKPQVTDVDEKLPAL